MLSGTGIRRGFSFISHQRREYKMKNFSTMMAAILAVMLTAGVAIGLAGCNHDGGGGDTSVTGVTLDKETLSLTVGQTYTLTPTVSPPNATNKAVTWSSNNEKVATVADGKVTAVAEGTTNITVTTVDGRKTDSATVTVVSKDDAEKAAENFTSDSKVTEVLNIDLDDVVPTDEKTITDIEEVLAKYDALSESTKAALDDEVKDKLEALRDAIAALTGGGKAAGATVSTPAASSTTATSITVAAVTVNGSTGQTAEYAISAANAEAGATAPETGWQAETTFNNLTTGATYYVYARARENDKYRAGTPGYYSPPSFGGCKTSFKVNGLPVQSLCRA
jgi:hypothetical protein